MKEIVITGTLSRVDAHKKLIAHEDYDETQDYMDITEPTDNCRRYVVCPKAVHLYETANYNDKEAAKFRKALEKHLNKKLGDK